MSALDNSYIEIRNLTFKREDKVIFDNITLNIPRNKVTGIMGSTGCGKTTLLRLIGAQLTPDSGEVVVNGHHLKKMRRKELFSLRKTMGMLFQSGALFTDMTVFENIAFPLRVHTDLPHYMIKDVVLMKLQAVGLRGAKDLMPAELSGGMTRRVALARAIVLDPDFIMYDEPFAGQDPISMGMLVKLISDLNNSLNITSLLVSHDLHETVSIADYLILLGEGKIIAEGSPEMLKTSENPFVRQFMNGNPDGPVLFHYPAIDYTQALLRGVHDSTLI